MQVWVLCPAAALADHYLFAAVGVFSAAAAGAESGMVGHLQGV